MSEERIVQLADMFRRWGPAVVLTGAGISTESGIPDFRSPGTGLYATLDPMEYLSAEALRDRPQQFWRYFAEVFFPVTEAQPNAGHIALARLEQAGYVSAIVTQNIDGLHQKAGSTVIYEVHGHLREARCSGCGCSYPLRQAVQQLGQDDVPRCEQCREMLRPEVVLFGDMMPEAFFQALEMVRAAHLLLAVGSSLSVSPANTLAWEAEHLAIINRDTTPADQRADLVIHAAAGETLTALVDMLLPSSPGIVG